MLLPPLAQGGGGVLLILTVPVVCFGDSEKMVVQDFSVFTSIHHTFAQTVSLSVVPAFCSMHIIILSVHRSLSVPFHFINVSCAEFRF